MQILRNFLTSGGKDALHQIRTADIPRTDGWNGPPEQSTASSPQASVAFPGSAGATLYRCRRIVERLQTLRLSPEQQEDLRISVLATDHMPPNEV